MVTPTRLESVDEAASDADGAGRGLVNYGAGRGVVTDDVGRLATRFVVVDGRGTVASSIASLLRASGVGSVQAGVWAADVADAELRLGGAPAPDLVVLVADAAVDPPAGEPWRRRKVMHLPVVTEAERIVVGPLVTGDAAAPCLECVRLMRSGGDAGRPAGFASRARWAAGSVVGQAGHAHHAAARVPPAPTPPAWDTSVPNGLVAMGSGMAVMVALSALRSGVPQGVSVDVHGPWPRVNHRRWQRRPDCANHQATSEVEPPDGPADDESAAASRSPPAS